MHTVKPELVTSHAQNPQFRGDDAGPPFGPAISRNPHYTAEQLATFQVGALACQVDVALKHPLSIGSHVCLQMGLQYLGGTTWYGCAYDLSPSQQ